MPARIIVCVGPGGVGKTSSSAALGLSLAREGRRVAVVTVDPARRLADALGIETSGGATRRIPEEAFRRAGVPVLKGRLDVSMLDVSSTLDGIVRRFHPNPEVREELERNPMYKALAGRLAGVQEYMGMERLFELVEADDYDVVILDTAPIQNALDFLDAPTKLLSVLENQGARWLMDAFAKDRGKSHRMFGSGAAFMGRTIARLTGPELLQDLSVLLAGLHRMFSGFEERARAVKDLLEAPDTRYLLVSRYETLPRVRGIRRQLAERSIAVSALLINRTAPDWAAASDIDRGVRETVFRLGGSTALASALASWTHGHRRRYEDEARAAGELKKDLMVARVPELRNVVASVREVSEMAEYLEADFLGALVCDDSP